MTDWEQQLAELIENEWWIIDDPDARSMTRVEYKLHAFIKKLLMETEVKTGLNAFGVTMEELKQTKLEEREKILALLEDEEENEHAGHEHDIDGNWCIRCSEAVRGRHPDYEYGRNQLRAELRQQIKEMK
jgi:hypothetical protein